jgi:hypothetical protein
VYYWGFPFWGSYVIRMFYKLCFVTKIYREIAMRKILLATVFGVVSVAAFSGANAIVFNKTATVKIVTPLSLSTTTDLNFATIERPATSSNLVVAPDGTTSGTATVITGTPTAGVYTVTGDAINQISIAVAAGAAVTGLTLGSFTMNYNNAAYTSGFTTAPGASTPLKIGATLGIDNTVASGTLTPGYNITILYQ